MGHKALAPERRRWLQDEKGTGALEHLFGSSVLTLQQQDRVQKGAGVHAVGYTAPRTSGREPVAVPGGKVAAARGVRAGRTPLP